MENIVEDTETLKRPHKTDEDDLLVDVASKNIKIIEPKPAFSFDKNFIHLILQHMTPQEVQQFSLASPKIHELIDTPKNLHPEGPNKIPFKWETESIDKHVFDLILQHLTIPEVLQLSLVCKDFNKLVGKSARFQNNIQFKIVDYDCKIAKNQRRLNLASDVKDSQRSYRHIQVKVSAIKEDELGLLFNNEWSSAILSITDISSSIRYVKYLNLIMPKLMSLQLSIGNIRKHDADVKLEFSSLKYLIISECTSSALEPFVKDEVNDTLQKLTLSAIRQSKNGMKLSKIIDCLMESFVSLIHLDLGSSVADIFFVNNVFNQGEDGFKLKELRVDAPASSKACENVENFIKSQGATLIEVCLLNWSRPETLNTIWNSMDKLKIWQMSNKKSRVKFEQMEMQIKRKTKLKILYLDFPFSTIPNGYLRTLLDGNCLDQIETNFAAYEKYIQDTLKRFAKKVTINGKVLHDESTEIDEISDDDSLFLQSSSDLDEIEENEPIEVPTIDLLDSD